jgi:hypothetical protein
MTNPRHFRKMPGSAIAITPNILTENFLQRFFSSLRLPTYSFLCPAHLIPNYPITVLNSCSLKMKGIHHGFPYIVMPLPVSEIQIYPSELWTPLVFAFLLGLNTNIILIQNQK